MALPTLNKTWQFNVNQYVSGKPRTVHTYDMEATAAQWLYLLKESLIGFASNPWTVTASSNQSTAGASDLWASKNNIHWSSSGARSWIVLRQAQVATNFEVFIDLNVNDQFPESMNLYVCVDGYDLTGISPTVVPTPNSVRNWKMNLDTVTGATYNGLSDVLYDFDPARLHVMMDTTGKSTRVLTCDRGLATQILAIEVPDDAGVWTPGWNDPVVVVQRGWYDQERVGYTYLNDNEGGRAYFEGTYNGTFDTYLTSEFYAGACMGQQQTFPDDVTGEWPMCPIGITTEAPGLRGPRRCTLTDLWWGSTALRTGDCYPENPSPTKEFAQFGDLIFPWNGTTPLVW